MARQVRRGFALAVCALLVASVYPASAGTAAGTITTSGTATLPVFPCPWPNPCQGTLEGSGVVDLQGIHQGTSWDVVMAAPHSVNFNYWQGLPPNFGQGPCVEGIIRGLASVDAAAAGEAVGTYNTTSPLPLAITRATLTYEVTGRITGQAIAWAFDNVRLVVKGPDLPGWPAGGIEVIGDGDGENLDGAGTFALNANAQNIPDCVTGSPSEQTATMTTAVRAQGDE